MKKHTRPYWQSLALSQAAPTGPLFAQTPQFRSAAILQYELRPAHWESSPHAEPGASEPGTLQASGGLATTTSSQLADSYAWAHAAMLVRLAPVLRALSAEEQTGLFRSMHRETSP
ncbi:MAG: hypothetical protein M3O46_13035 [Myxococcota bacterium]|nr:hypothetical protein [Myxococcota bacterium]